MQGFQNRRIIADGGSGGGCWGERGCDGRK